ncbi:hypothetical protein P175DRAFT_0210150 [Aspergillus ochraceoroseus IBT 24754]|uniref:Xaa-Pro dipeptidyl-peptidase C-terminal domain-containing protein n=2 Tax=Aspergillus ochraceoroseus TaxID=138278 RepID=A0A2T5M0I1_9EURO|nr:uncharacterized protein P175DRAFT_0210150 [Aspergillus ochraceoroseus IBT 24754]KKK12608.1 hypothetical protein AOCH_002277 [Aspergillus ochraceoroseus]PTU22041.1 hypothetical protein P175DRAFT_0210150 [Aspergillus ochraceoroseus IBT 24754]
MATEIGGTKITFGDPRQPKALPLSHPKARWGEFGRKTTVLPKGYVRRRGCLPLPCDILFDRDIAVRLRDGVVIYLDVYRPVNDVLKIPALLAWSPYGKQGGRGNQVLDDFPFRMAVPLRKLSELQKWEGPDPAYWVQHGYAVINADPRGVGKSEGDIYHFGSQEGRDGADVVDWIGEQPWCSGKVGLSGNSYLSISQWFIAAERPKYLAAIAPWEGLSDLFGEGLALGGTITTPSLNFDLQLLQVNAGENSWENATQMVIDHDVFGPYHDDKRARVENINVPAYVVASWSNPIHTFGTFCAYMKLTSEKWLRVHDTWEWPDYYDEVNRTDLHRFFDRYLKGIDNGWEKTPKVRVKIIDTAIPTTRQGVDMTFSAFPPPQSIPMKLFFNGMDGSLSAAYPPSSRVEYQVKTGGCEFIYKFETDAVLCGPIDLCLAVSLAEAADSDIFITFEKILTSGYVGSQLIVPYERLYQSFLIRAANRAGLAPETQVLFYKGPAGQARLSRREPHPHDNIPGFRKANMEVRTFVKQHETVLFRPSVGPIGMNFAKGEQLRLRVSGQNPAVFPPVDQATLTVDNFQNPNETGVVSIHCGTYDKSGSYVTLPLLSQC